MLSAGDRLREARAAKGFASATDAASALGIKAAAYRHHENGTRGIDPDAAYRYGRFFGVSPAWILWGIDSRGSRPEGAGLISWVAAGGMAEVIDNFEPGDAEDWIDYPAKHSKIIALKVRGNSMNRISPEGSIIIVDLLQREMSANRLYVVKIGDDATYKRYRDNPPRLEPESTESHDTIFLGGEEVQPIGRVIRTMIDFE